MADASISRLVLLIISLTIATIIGGVVLQYSERISGSIKERGDGLSKQFETDISIINDPQYMTENENITGPGGNGVDNYIVLYVKNTGSSTLENKRNLVNVFLDGEMLREDNIESMRVINESYWRPHAVVRILTDYTATELGENQDHKAKVITFNTEDSLKFRL